MFHGRERYHVYRAVPDIEKFKLAISLAEFSDPIDLAQNPTASHISPLLLHFHWAIKKDVIKSQNKYIPLWSAVARSQRISDGIGSTVHEPCTRDLPSQRKHTYIYWELSSNPRDHPEKSDLRHDLIRQGDSSPGLQNPNHIFLPQFLFSCDHILVQINER